jgi:hypothetical protein
VGKIHPEIAPGKYTWKEVQDNPAFKELLLPGLLGKIKPGGPPFAMNIPEFEIVPTHQYYWSLPIAEMTKQNSGKTKLDENGYLVLGTWEGGYPFPKPSGPHKAIQIMYNFEKRYVSWNNCMVHYTRGLGADKNLSIDNEATNLVRRMTLSGRAVFEPFGYYDETAKNGLEFSTYVVGFLAPRDTMGAAQYQKVDHGYSGPDHGCRPHL